MQANFNKKILCSLILASCVANIGATAAEDDFDLDEALTMEPGEPSKTALRDPSNDCPPSQLLELLVNGGAVSLLQKNIYLKTNPINVRSLLDMPSLYPIIDMRSKCDRLDLYMIPFYNQMSKAYYTENSPFISSYVNLSAQDLIESLGEDTPLQSVGFDEVLDLFQGMKIQERRLGAMFGIFDQTDHSIYNIYLPVYYLEHNFFLTDQERNALINSQFFKDYGIQGDSEGELNFAFDHLVNDRLGIGDTRVDIKTIAHEGENLNVWVGMQATIPTAMTFKDGVMGAVFNPACVFPQFNLTEVMTGVVCNKPGTYAFQQAKQQGVDLMVGAVDRLSAMLINVPMGNRGHLGLAPQITFDQRVGCNSTLITNICLEYFFGAKEERFFLVNKDNINFNRNYSDDSQALANLNFLSDQIINTLFPKVCEVRVTPGYLLKFNEKFQHNTERWDFIFEFDFWRQAQEKVDLQNNLLDCSKGIKPAAYQGKLVGQCVYNFRSDRSGNGKFGLTGDVTIFNKGIGKDFTVGFYASMDF